MADLQILAPLRSVRPAFNWRDRLDGTFYLLRMSFNTRRKLWAVDLRASDGSALKLGISGVVGVSLFEPWRGLVGFPPGQLFLEDTEGLFVDPGRRDLLGRVRMGYRPEADVLAAAGTDAELF